MEHVPKMTLIDQNRLTRAQKADLLEQALNVLALGSYHVKPDDQDGKIVAKSIERATEILLKIKG